MMVPALAVLSFIRPALFAASVAALSYLCNRMLTGRPLTVYTRELWLGVEAFFWVGLHHDPDIRTSPGEASRSSPACS